MANQKFMTKENGVNKLVTSVNLSAGVDDAGKIPCLNDSGKIDVTMMPEGIRADVFVAPASEDLNAGDFVNIFDDAGTVKVRKADSSSTAKPAMGFVKEVVTTGDNATVYREGDNTGLTSLTVGTRYFLDGGANAGLITATAPTTAGSIIQSVGIAHAATSIRFEIEEPTIIE